MSQSLITPERDARGRLLPGHSVRSPGHPKAPEYSRAKLRQALADENYDPIREMIALARDPDSSNYLRFEVAKEITSYLMPKQKAIQLQDPDGTPASLTIRWDIDESPAQQAANGVENALTTIVEAVVDDDDER